MKAWERVLKARRSDRPTAQRYIEAFSEDFIELHGDRYYHDDAAIIGGIGMLGEIPVTFIGQEKDLKPRKRLSETLACLIPMAIVKLTFNEAS